MYNIITDTEIISFERKRVKSEYRKSRREGCFLSSWALEPQEALIAADERRLGEVEGKARAPNTNLCFYCGTCVLRRFVSSFCVRCKHLQTLTMTIFTYRAIKKTYVIEMKIEWNIEWEEINRLIWVSPVVYFYRLGKPHPRFAVTSSLFTTCNYYFTFGIVIIS